MLNKLSFTGRYALKGKTEQVNRALCTIKSIKKDDVAFFNITSGDNKISIVATDEDKKQLEDKKADSNFCNEIRKISKEKQNRLAGLFEHIFGSDENALLIQGDQLAKFALATSSINYSTGASKTKYQKVEKFIDGSSKTYNSKGRLSEIIHKDGTKEEIFLNGARKITKPDGTIETIGVLKPSYIRDEAPEEKQIKEARQSEKRETFATEDVKSEPMHSKAKAKTKNKKIMIPFAMPIVIEEPQIHPLDLVFEKYLGKGGIIDYENETISLPYRDGIRQVLNKDGSLRSFIFPDGTIKNYDKYQNITEKIYPDGKIEFFNSDGRMYLTLHSDGTKEYSKLIV